MAMSRDEILQRMVTGAAYIEREDITKAQRDKAWARYEELETELHRLNEIEKQYKPPVPEEVQANMDKIWDTLKKERKHGSNSA